MGLCYAPLVLVNLPVALAIWVGIEFNASLPALSVGPNAAGVLIAVGWLGTIGVRRDEIAEGLRAHRKMLAAGALLLIWFALSAVWAVDPGRTAADLPQWLAPGAGPGGGGTARSTPPPAHPVIGGV